MLEDFVDSLNLDFEGEVNGDSYVIDMDTSDEFSQLFTRIANDSEFSCEDDSIASNEKTFFVYYNDEYDIELRADYVDDVYSCVIRER